MLEHTFLKHAAKIICVPKYPDCMGRVFFLNILKSPTLINFSIYYLKQESSKIQGTVLLTDYMTFQRHQ